MKGLKLLRLGGTKRLWLLCLVVLAATAVRGSVEESEASCVVGPDGSCLVSEEQPSEPQAAEDNEETIEEEVGFPRIALVTNEELDEEQEEDDEGDEEEQPEEGDDVELPPANPEDYVDIGYGEPQLVSSTDEENEKTMELLKDVIKYMRDQVFEDPFFESVRSECKNRNELCAYWAVSGECENNPGYMKIHCAPVCFSCEQVSFETRCPVTPELLATRVWQSGDIDKMFRRILEEYKDQVTIITQPADPSTSNTDQTGGPWAVTIDNFLTPEECDTLIELGAIQGYEISQDVGEKNYDGTYDGVQSEGRTSTNAWCVEDCYQNATTQNILQKLERLTGIPDINSEYLQMLKYEVGEFYEDHHDYIEYDVDRPSGVRILTAFMYLNDVEEGGGTHFTSLKLTVKPVKGRLLLWPSVLDTDTNEKDERTNHQALPVRKGTKYGANAWFHQRDFKTPHETNCS